MSDVLAIIYWLFDFLSSLLEMRKSRESSLSITEKDDEDRVRES